MAFSWLRSLCSGRSVPIRNRPVRPWVEALEGRVTPAVFRVTDTADQPLAPGQVTVSTAPGVDFDAVTLRAAVAAANNTLGVADRIIVPAGLYQLTHLGVNEDADATGDLDVTDDLTVVGAGPAFTILDGNLTDRVFDVVTADVVSFAKPAAAPGDAAVTLTLQNLAIQNGRAGPGDVGLNPTDAGGGAAFARDTNNLAIQNCALHDNQANAGAGGRAFGGAILVAGGNLTLTDSAVTTNRARSGDSFDREGAPDVAQGGGIAVTGLIDSDFGPISGTTLIARSTIANNQAIGGAGDFAGGEADGGGVAVLFGEVTISDSTLSGNQANGGSADSSEVSGGDARGGGFFGDSFLTPIPGEEGEQRVSAELLASDSTFSGNQANGGPNDAPDNGGAGSTAQGGGLFLASGGTLQNSTVTLNQTNGGNGDPEAGEQAASPIGQGGGVYSQAAVAPPRLVSTIIAKNTFTGASDSGGPDVFGSFAAASHHNLIGIGDGSTGLTDTRATRTPADADYQQVGTGVAPINPLLGPLAPNGGPTLTHSLLTGSPAIDRGDNPATLANDQRGPGFQRTSGPRTDVGAFEVQLPSSLAGFVYRDRNNDGLYEPALGETGVAGVAVTLTGSDALGPIAPITIVTAADGSYRFGNLRPGVYTLTETQPRSFHDGKDYQGTPGGGIVSNDRIANIPLASGVDGTDNNFGELPPGRVAGVVYVDRNNDGLYEPGRGERGLRGVLVRLTGAGLTRTAVTAADGSYQFTGLPAGTYAVREVIQPAGYLDGKDTRDNTAPLPNSARTDVIGSIIVTVGASAAKNHFGELRRSSLAGQVYLDANANGRRDLGELGLGGVQVVLTGTNDLGQTVRVVTFTAGTGAYTFSDLRSGTYLIAEVQPLGFAQGANHGGTLPARIAGDRFQGIVLPAGAVGTGFDFGEHGLFVAIISKRLFLAR